MKKIFLAALLITIASCTSLKQNNNEYINGYFSYMADAALFVDSKTNQKYPVAMEEDYINLEKEYLKNFKGGEQAFITIKARIEKRDKMEGEGKIDYLIVEKLIKISKK